MAVIPRSRHDGALPQVIEPAVAYMGPPGRALLDDTNRTGSAWPMFDGKVGPQLDDLFMRSTQSEVQKAHGIEDGLRRVPERLDQRPTGRHYADRGVLFDRSLTLRSPGRVSSPR